MLTNNRDDNSSKRIWIIYPIYDYKFKRVSNTEEAFSRTKHVSITRNNNINVDSQANLNITHEDSIALKLEG